MPHFISTTHDSPDYDLYLGQVELCFRFKHILPSGSIEVEEMALDHYRVPARIPKTL